MELFDLVADVVRPLGYEVLEVTLRGAGKNRVLTVRLERADEAPITLADLERASEVISLELDRLDPIPGSYRLEVESPGPERPLLTRRHFERFLGLRAKVQSPEGRFTGRIEAVEGDAVTFRLDSGETRTLTVGTFKANLAEWPETPR